jgi:hypothetical protein
MNPLSTVTTTAREAHASPLSAGHLLLALLVCIDVLFIGVHVMHAWTPWMNGSHYAIDTDRGLAEIFQYTKLIWICMCLTLAYLFSRRFVFLY